MGYYALFYDTVDDFTARRAADRGSICASYVRLTPAASSCWRVRSLNRRTGPCWSFVPTGGRWLRTLPAKTLTW